MCCGANEPATISMYRYRLETSAKLTSLLTHYTPENPLIWYIFFSPNRDLFIIFFKCKLIYSCSLSEFPLWLFFSHFFFIISSFHHMIQVVRNSMVSDVIRPFHCTSFSPFNCHFAWIFLNVKTSQVEKNIIMLKSSSHASTSNFYDKLRNPLMLVLKQRRRRFWRILVYFSLHSVHSYKCK